MVSVVVGETASVVDCVQWQ